MGTINLKTSLRRIGFLKENPEKYVTTVVRYSTIGSEELIKMASENSGIPKAQMAASFYALNQQIEQFVLNGHALEIGSLGTLYLTSNAKASDSREEAGVDSLVRISVRFRQSKKIRNLLNSNVNFSLPSLKKKKEEGDATGDENPDGNGGNTGGNGENEETDPLG